MDKEANSSVNCNAFENRIQELMDQRIDLSRDRPLQEHAAHCPECKTVLSNFCALEQALFVTFDSDSLAVNQQIHASRHSHSVINWSIAGAIMAIAAVLVVIVVPVLNRESGTIAVAKNDAPSAAIDAPILTEQKEQLAVEPELELPPRPSISLVNYDLPPTLRNAYQYAVELPGIRPIECSVNATIEALQNSWKTFPQSKQNKKDPDLGNFGFLNQNGLA